MSFELDKDDVVYSDGKDNPPFDARILHHEEQSALFSDTQNFDVQNLDARFVEQYVDTDKKIDKIVDDNDFYTDILNAVNAGTTQLSLTKRFMLRSIDKIWVDAVEDALPALDIVIRSPSRFIEETEEIMPIELSKNISERSLKHLAQHTDYISKVDEDGRITPTKILNVFRDETVGTYENKFINTLVHRLYSFVNLRYNVALKQGVDTKLADLDMVQNFEHNGAKGTISLNIRLEERTADEEVSKNYATTGDLWRRVVKLNSVCRSYLDSELCRALGKTFIRPPVMRTNAILKNKNLRQCLALWQFIEGYSDAGYGILVKENVEDLNDNYVKNLYKLSAVQYLVFRRSILKDFDAEDDAAIKEFYPRINEQNKPLDEEEFDVHIDNPLPEYVKNPDLTAQEKEILQAIRVALLADKQIEEERQAAAANIPESMLRRSFTAKLIQSEEKTQDFYSQLKNHILSYKKVKSRVSWDYDSFNRGRLKLAKIGYRGKTLTLYLALDCEQFDRNKYHFAPATSAKFKDVPMMLKVRSPRALKYAKELIDILMAQHGIKQLEISTIDYRLPYESTQQLVDRGLIKVIGDAVIPDDERETEEEVVEETEEVAESVDQDGKNIIISFRRSFTAKLIQSEEKTQDFYSQLKNHILSYKKVKSRVSWDYDSFNRGRLKLAKIGYRGKTLTLYLALDCEQFDRNKYHFAPATSAKFKDVPMMLKVRSPRALKYAKELIDILMAQHGIKQLEISTIDYRLPYESTQQLVDRGLIKVIGDAVIPDDERETEEEVVEETEEVAADETTATAEETPTTDEQQPQTIDKTEQAQTQGEQNELQDELGNKNDDTLADICDKNESVNEPLQDKSGESDDLSEPQNDQKEVLRQEIPQKRRRSFMEWLKDLFKPKKR